MKVYQTFPSEQREFKDRVTGLPVQQLTSYLGHSVHPYFTDNGWYDNNTKMLFRSDRGNATNIFSVAVETGEIKQLTSFASTSPSFSSPLDINHIKNEVYYTQNGCLYALSLETLQNRPLYIPPLGYYFGGARPTANGKYVIAGLREDLSDRVQANLSAGYIGMRDIWKANPHSQILRIDVETREVKVVWDEEYWVGHINPSPTQGNLITFCHEGPWQLVDHRIWLLDLNTGKVKKIRERENEFELIGHEYWLADGIHIGYQVHERRPESSTSAFGFAHFDGTIVREAPCASLPSPDHIHSVDMDVVVSDAGKSIKAYVFNGTDYDPPKVISMHDGSFDWGGHHPHPRVTDDGKKVVYNSTAAGYCNIYMTDIPKDFTELPLAEDIENFRK